MDKEDEIDISKKGIETFGLEKSKQEGTIKKCKDNYEILEFNSKVKRFATNDEKKFLGQILILIKIIRKLNHLKKNVMKIKHLFLKLIVIEKIFLKSIKMIYIH